MQLAMRSDLNVWPFKLALTSNTPNGRLHSMTGQLSKWFTNRDFGHGGKAEFCMINTALYGWLRNSFFILHISSWTVTAWMWFYSKTICLQIPTNRNFARKRYKRTLCLVSILQSAATWITGKSQAKSTWSLTVTSCCGKLSLFAVFGVSVPYNRSILEMQSHM